MIIDRLPKKIEHILKKKYKKEIVYYTMDSIFFLPIHAWFKSGHQYINSKYHVHYRVSGQKIYVTTIYDKRNHLFNSGGYRKGDDSPSLTSSFGGMAY